MPADGRSALLRVLGSGTAQLVGRPAADGLAEPGAQSSWTKWPAPFEHDSAVAREDLLEALPLPVPERDVAIAAQDAGREMSKPLQASLHFGEVRAALDDLTSHDVGRQAIRSLGERRAVGRHHFGLAVASGESRPGRGS